MLGSIRVPTLVLHREDGGQARHVADHIQMRCRPSRRQGTMVFTDDVSDAVLSFLRGETVAWVPESVLATVLFTDLVGSTEYAASSEIARGEMSSTVTTRVCAANSVRHRGIEIDSAGDGFFCRFEGPAPAVACARRIVEGATELGLEVRAGCPHGRVRTHR